MCVFGNHTDTGGPHLLPLTTPFTTCLGVTARAASDIDASALQIIAALDGAAELSGWAYRQAVARAHGAADRLLANSRHALDAADPVSLRWRDVQAGRRLADAVITRG